MLNKITIKNIALIDYAEIDFTDGFNVLSGETGSGKSVIIESLNFVLGARADASFIRNGQNECSVTAEFDVSLNQSVKDIYAELDIEYDDTLIISRKFTLDKKSTVKINGVSANVSMVKRFTSVLVDVHGQSEHFSLLSESNQLKLLDKFGGKDLTEIKEKLKEDYQKYSVIKKQLDELGGDENQRLIRLDIINYQLNEIEKAELYDGEEEKLLEIKEKLKYQEKISSALNTLNQSITEEGNALDIISNALRSVNGIASLSNDYNSLYERLDSVYNELSDLGDTSSTLLESIDQSEYTLDQVNERLDYIKTLKRKYGNSYQEIISFYQSIIEEKKKLENFNELNDSLLSEKIKIENTLYLEYQKLSETRKTTAKSFAKGIESELTELGMNKAKFDISFSDFPSKSDCPFDSANGIDKIEFLFSANSGEPVKPLSVVISGGEISRFMLSIKVLTAKYNDISTFIFDEIDAGISGVVARTVAEKLTKISKDVQVIAITHLPQISSFADNNLLIRKIENEDKTTTVVKTLNEEEKIEEITRLIGGSLNSSSREHSISLIESAKEFKKSL